jgi:beta-glucanase (GH16 family)
VARLTFDDEFNTLGAPWQPVYPWSTDGWPTSGSWLANPNLLPADANPLSIANGAVTLADISRPADVAPNMVGGLDRIGSQILTQNNFAQTYGYFEARIQMPAGNGEGGAFWLMPESGAWPPELDIAEVSGSSPTTLSTSLLLDPDAPIGSWRNEPDMSQAFHTYAVNWTPTTITWYFDNQQVYQIDTPAEMNQPMYLIFSINSGTTQTVEGAAGPSTIGQMKIDWVHVYDSNPYATTPTPAPAATGASPQASDVVVDLGNVTLTATSAAQFIFSGPGHDAVINNVDAATNGIDFEMTAQDFADIAFRQAGDGHALIDFDGNHVSLPGVMLDQLGWNNFTIAGHSHPHPS